MSQPCAFGSCRRKVRRDNPTFPYCHDHYQQAKPGPRTEHLSNSEFKSYRERLYKPEKAILSVAAASAGYMADAVPGVNRNALFKTFNSWRKATKGIDMSHPDEAKKLRGELIDDAKSILQKSSDAQLCKCTGGKARSVKDGVFNISDHTVVLAEDESGSTIYDVATSAPFSNKIHSSLRDYFADEHSPCADGFYVAHIFEYAAFNTTTYDSFTTEDGEEVWSNRQKKNDEVTPIEYSYRLDSIYPEVEVFPMEKKEQSGDVIYDDDGNPIAPIAK